MRLKFIGADGSKQLTHGEVYDVEIKTTLKNDYIWVVMPKFEFRHMIFGVWKCPYSSPQALAKNWTKP